MTEAPPHVQVLQMIVGKWTSAALSALASLGVPDHLESGPRSVDELAAAVDARPDLLYRLMRATASVGVLRERPDGQFEQTPLSDALRTNASPSFRHVAMFFADEWHMRGWNHLAETVRTGERPIERAFGVPVFEYLGQNPDAAETFNRGMTNMSMLDAPAVADAYDFSGIESITDVGGGHGYLIATILARNPGIRGTLYDLPQVISGVEGGPTDPVRDRMKFVAGNMFESVPAGSDAYLMKYIIHDWPDEQSTALLRHCRQGVNPGGRLLVVDSVVPVDNASAVGKFSDLEMMLFPGGKERTEDEFRELLRAAGWSLSRVVPTASHVSIVEGAPI